MWSSRKPYLFMLISMTIVAAIPLMFSVFLWWGASGIVNNQMNEIIEVSHMQNHAKVDNALYELKRISMRVSADSTVKSLLRSNSTRLTGTERVGIYETRMKLLEYLKSGPESIRDIYLYSNQSNYAVSSSAMYDDKMFGEVYYNKSQLDAEGFEELHKEYTMGKLAGLGHKNNFLVFTSSISNRLNNGVPDWQLVIILNNNFFRNSFFTSQNKLEADFIIIDKAGTIVLTGDSGLNIDSATLNELSKSYAHSQIMLDEKPYLSYTTYSNVGDYLFCSLISYDYLKSQTFKLTQLSLAVLVLCLILAATAIILLSRRNYIPISRLLKYIQENYGASDSDSADEGIYAIQSTVQKLIVQKHKAEQQLDEYNKKIGLDYLKALLQGQKEQNTINHNSRQSHINWITNRNYIVACFYPVIYDLYEETENIQIYSDLERCRQIVVEVCELMLSEACYWETTIINGMIVTVIGSRIPEEQTINLAKNNSEEVQQQIDWYVDFIEQISLYINDNYEWSIQTSISRLHMGEEQLETAFREASLAMEYCFAHNEVVLSRFDDCEFNAGFFLRDWIHINKLMQFTSLVTSGDFDEANNCLDDLFPDVYLDGILKESELSKLQLASLKYQFLQVMDSIYGQFEQLQLTRNETIRRIISSRDHNELKVIMRQQLILAGEHLPARKELSENDIEEIKQYIKENYDNNQLNVSSIAAYFDVVPNTLSKYFTRKTNSSLLQYIHMIRINKAVEILKSEPNLTLSEIAAKVGYSNTLTFTRAFKSANQGMTPGEYKTMILDNR